jgi:hypothetical protein
MRPIGHGLAPGTPCQIAVKRPGGGRAAAFFAKALDPNYLDRMIERQRHHVAQAYQLAGRGHPCAVEPHKARFRQCRSVAARANHARVPEPFVDALAIQGFKACA